ncbi:MAG: hypothetical protein H6745_20140 [Deltaproteobacteria bacterium]|nr:hypothetical protein [Deltaproteobacteria bacterium]
MRFYLPILAAGALAAGACADNAAPTSSLGDTPLNLDIAALTLDGVSDAIWDIQVKNEADATVFEARITSSGYGDGAGSASYVGTCDAQTNSNTNDKTSGGPDDTKHWNEVNVWIVGVYKHTFAGTLGDFGDSPAPGNVFESTAEAAETIQNPGVLTQYIDCKENQDAFVEFNVAVMRPANQGFFDIAVNFNDIYCSAKYDCNVGDFLHDVDATNGSAREKTHVIGLACTSGSGTNADTTLLMTDITIKCYDSNAVLQSTVTIAPNGDGNLCTGVASDSGGLGSGNCDANVLTISPSGTAPLFQIAAYQGKESTATTQAIQYWNVALGLLDTSPYTGACTVSFDATADDATNPVLSGAGDGDGTANNIDQGTVYPFIEFQIADLFGCNTEEKLNVANSGVQSRYTATSNETATSTSPFGHGVFGNSYSAP